MGTTWAKRLRTISGAMAGGTEAVSGEQFEEILGSKRPYSIAAIGFAGLLVILWLMIFKPTLGFGGAAAQECPPVQAAVSVCALDDQSFVPTRLETPAAEAFELGLANGDPGVEHNVAIYTDESAKKSLFVGDFILGVGTGRYEVPALDPGEYFFRCDIHPQMNGTLEAA
jgi:hypothetical protein